MNKELELTQAYVDVFVNSPAGKLVLADLEDRSHINETSVSIGPNGAFDPYSVFFCEGQRDLCLYIRDMVRRHSKLMEMEQKGA